MNATVNVSNAHSSVPRDCQSIDLADGRSQCSVVEEHYLTSEHQSAGSDQDSRWRPAVDVFVPFAVV